MDTALLELAGLSKSFGRVVVADNLSVSVCAGDLVGIVGPNGAGKSSLFGLIAGDLAPSAGEIKFNGAPVIRLDAAARCRLGIGRTFQVPKPFGAMTVFENVLVAVRQGSGLRRRPSYAAASVIVDLTGLTGDANNAGSDSDCSRASGSRWPGRSRPGPGSCCSTRWRAD